jgi:hypothetical protein
MLQGMRMAAAIRAVQAGQWLPPGGGANLELGAVSCLQGRTIAEQPMTLVEFGHRLAVGVLQAALRYEVVLCHRSQVTRLIVRCDVN